MKEIPLTQNKIALVDDADFLLVSQHKWAAYCRHNIWYAKTKICIRGKLCQVDMHRLILGLSPQDKTQVDHIKHNGLDNRRTQIRKCTHAQNDRNRRPKRDSSSKYKGVCWIKRANKWKAQLQISDQKHYLGLFVAEIDAAKAYDIKAKELFGEFAYLNFP